MRVIQFTILSILLFQTLFAQHDPYSGPQWRGSKIKTDKIDSTSLLYAFRNGEFNGNFRYFFMATMNQDSLTDYYANAAGGGIRYETAPFKGFQFAISGYFIFNVGSSDLSKRDPYSNAANRYEIGLFDIEDPNNERDLDRLEEFYLKYSNEKYKIVLGKQILRTPFINPQDGRMRPTEVEGLWAEYKSSEKFSLNGGWLYKISPRSTIKWYSVGHSIGVYPQGVTTSGKPAMYRNALNSAGIFLAQGNYKINDRLSISVMEQFTENIFNTAWAQVNYSKKLGNKTLQAAVQIARQDPVNDGGNADRERTYFEPGTYANIISSRIGWIDGPWQTSLNYTRIGKGGRYLSPREWGRDPFFTFLPRERNEGLGDVHAIMGKATRKIPKANLVLDLGIGYYDLPDARDFKHNKYGLVSYVQSNAELKYEFQGFLYGLDLDVLYVYKARVGETYNDPKLVINRVNMSNINVILNYHF
ncbi:MAG TPA: OprD family outer membrane porin [Phnomibacter sp.]|nr:OprD family outer membrane porin [Phnomibacter sp.]